MCFKVIEMFILLGMNRSFVSCLTCSVVDFEALEYVGSMFVVIEFPFGVIVTAMIVLLHVTQEVTS